MPSVSNKLPAEPPPELELLELLEDELELLEDELELLELLEDELELLELELELEEELLEELELEDELDELEDELELLEVELPLEEVPPHAARVAANTPVHISFAKGN